MHPMGAGVADRRKLMVAVLGVLLLAAVGVAASRTPQAEPAVVAVVNVDRITQEYLRPELDVPLQEETRKLQAEFDEKAKDLSDKEKQELFQQYQSRLDQRKQEMVDAVLPKVQEAIAKVAQAAGVEVVIDKQATLWGGLDLTDKVLLELGVKVK